MIDDGRIGFRWPHQSANSFTCTMATAGSLCLIEPSALERREIVRRRNRAGALEIVARLVGFGGLIVATEKSSGPTRAP